MKRCPECRRDYYDDSLLYCLDDGTALLEGPASGNESATALLSSIPSKENFSSEAATRTLGSAAEENHRTAFGSRRGTIAIAVCVVAAIAAAGYFAVRYYKPAASGSINSVAVLPFQNRSDDPDTDYLSDGLAESLIFRLSQLPGLRVSPTSSVMQYKGSSTDPRVVAKDLGVDAVMTGRLVKRGDNLNISVELVDARSNASLWGEQYERKMSDLLATQREIAATIVQKLQVKLAGNEKAITKKYTDSNEAYQLYLQGRFVFAKRDKENVYKAIHFYEQAIALDGNFALAYAALSEAYSVLPSFEYVPPDEGFPKAKAAANKALELDPELPEAHISAGVIAAAYDWDWPLAEKEFKRALELEPNSAAAHFRYAWIYLSPLGRHEEAIAEQRKALELEPLSLIHNSIYGAILTHARRADEAIAQLRKTTELDPNFRSAFVWLCHAYNVKGQYAESLNIAENLESPSRSLMAYSFAKMGRRDEALAYIAQYKQKQQEIYLESYPMARVYAALGDKDAAFAELEKSSRLHEWSMQYLKVDPFLDPLRDDPRFAEMLEKMKYPD